MRLFALAFVLGAVCLQTHAQLPAGNPGALGIATLLCAALWRKRPVLRVVAVMLAGGLCGYGLALDRAVRALADALPPAWEGRDIVLTGIVASLPDPRDTATRFLLDVESVETAGASVPRRISLSWYPQREKGGGVQAPVELRAGERWRLAVRLKRPRGLANAHGFDFGAWALERGIRATGYVRSRTQASRLAGRVDGWPWTVHRWRGEIRDAMNAHLEQSRWAGVLLALAIGDQNAIAAPDWQVFWRTGVGHLMSISGLHITMLAALAFAFVRFAWVRLPGLALRLPARKAGVIGAVCVAFAYSLIAGYGVPAQRTCIMLATLGACVLCNRHASPSRVLALCAMVVVAIDPWAVLSAGFWLSFGAVAAIFYAMSLRTGTAGKLVLAAREQVAVTVAMLPMLLALFQEASLASPLANAFAIPLVSLGVVPLTLAGAAFDSAALLAAAHGLLWLTMQPLEMLAASPLAMLESRSPSPAAVIAAAIGCAWLLAPRGFPLRPAGAIWIAPLFLLAVPRPGPGEAWIDVLDVGQGLAVVARTASHALVYDAGPGWNADADSGSRIVVPFLRGEGVRPLDALVVSHGDADHYGGAASVARARRPGWLLSSLGPDDPLHAEFTTSLRCEAGQAWTWDGVRFEVLHPAAPAYLQASTRRNDLGCVLRVAAKGAAVLLAADIEARAEAAMLERGAGALRSDALLVPHHGSRTSSTPAFLDAVSPRVALLSSGYRNRFGHPHAEVMARYAARAIPVHRTERRGALRLVLPAHGGGPLVVTGLEARRRYWSDRGVGR